MNKKCLFFATLCMLLLLLCGCGENKKPTEPTTQAPHTDIYAVNPAETEDMQISDDTAAEQPKEEQATLPICAEDLTTEQKVGQLFILRPDSLNISASGKVVSESEEAGVTRVNDNVRRALQQYYVGGVCQFAKNIETPDQLKKFNQELQAASVIPMFITVDEEGGSVARLANHKQFHLTKYKSAAAVAKSGKTKDAEKMGQTIGKYLKEYGFNMDFAPDADVNTNPNNPVIGNRAFSSDARTASKMVAAAAQGLRDYGILPTLKHFPGHGDTAEDSHSALAVTHKTLEQLQECEFLPFGADTGIHCVMVGHIATPKITGDNIPASLNPAMIQLIPDYKNTLIVTDSLAMQAVTDSYSSSEAAVKAFLAGCDLLLMPKDFVAAYNGIMEAVQSGRISEKRLNESVDKILSYKQQFVYEQ